MPTNLYGTNDNYDLQNSHVLPALIRKFHTAKITGAPSVTLWGTGSPKRELLYVDDLANACLHLMQHYNEKQFLNMGTGEDMAIPELAELIKNIANYGGEIIWDKTKPDGTPRKLMDVSKAHALGWKHNISLEEGIKKTYADFLSLDFS